MSQQPTILVANDDGIYAPGIRALAQAMAGLGRVVVVAPDVEQSGVGHSITFRRPLRFRETKSLDFGCPAYRVDGTPADCVVLGVHHLGRVDLVVSGINIGSNLGFDLTHSGTVAAVLEGTSLGIPSIAFSLRTGSDDLDFSHGASYATTIAREVLGRGLPAKTFLNVNFPVGVPRGVRLAAQGTHKYEDNVVKRTDPDGQDYFWVSGVPTGDEAPDSDYTAVAEGYIAVSPLRMDFTNREFLDEVRGWLPGV
jgi:5'-nucleotidase